MAGLVPATHVFQMSKTWMPGMKPGMTVVFYPAHSRASGNPVWVPAFAGTSGNLRLLCNSGAAQPRKDS
jgi:hypothetical protein